MSLEIRKQHKLTVKSTAANSNPPPPSYQYFNIQIWIWIFNGNDNMTSFICHFWLLQFQYNIWYQILSSWFRYTTNDMVIYLLFSFWLGRGRFWPSWGCWGCCCCSLCSSLNQGLYCCIVINIHTFNIGIQSHSQVSILFYKEKKHIRLNVCFAWSQ